MGLTLLSMNTENFTLYQGVVVAVSGIITVLLILALISFCIWVLSKIIYAAEHNNDEKTIIRKVRKAPAAPVAAAPEPAGNDPGDDKALIAAITAAIAASLNRSTDDLVVRSFRKSANWQKEAIYEHKNYPNAL